MIGSNVKKIWDNRNKILEGIKNSIFINDAVEIIAEERLNICKECPSGKYDIEGENCYVKGTQPCCGECGCSLHLKTRSLSSGCDFDYWGPVLTEAEELEHNILNSKNDD